MTLSEVERIQNPKHGRRVHDYTMFECASLSRWTRMNIARSNKHLSTSTTAMAWRDGAVGSGKRGCRGDFDAV